MTGQNKVLILAKENKELREKLKRTEQREIALIQKVADQQSQIIEGQILINLFQLRLREVGIKLQL